MYSHQQNYKKAFKWSEDLRSRYLHTLAAFRIFERFKKLAASNIVGKKKAEANVKTFSQHIYFFMPLQEAARYYFFIELAKFFDENRRDQSLTLELVLNFIEKNIYSFSEKEFKKYHSERVFVPELLKGYAQISLKEIKKIRNRLNRNKKLIAELKTYRDQFLAHDDIKKDDVSISGNQIKVLLKIVRDTVDLLYLRLDFSSNSYSNYDKEPAWAVDSVVNALQEHEQERIRIIKKKYSQ